MNRGSKLLQLKQDMQRNKNDIYYTPTGAIKAWFEEFFTFKNIKVDKFYEVCDPGNSLISKFLRESHFEVISSDVEFDFINNSLREYSENDYIITNPPYSIKDKFFEKSLNIAKEYSISGISYLVPITCLEGSFRSKIFKEFNKLNYSIEVLIFPKRINFMWDDYKSPKFGESFGGTFNVSWFNFYKYKGDCVLNTFKYSDWGSK